VWQAGTGQVQLTFSAQSGPIFSLAFNPSNPTQLVTASADSLTTAKVWDIATGQLLYLLEDPTAQVNGLAFSRDGTRLATASSDRTVKIWDMTVTPPKKLFTLPEHTDQATSVAFSPDQKYLAVSIADGTVRLHPLEFNDLIPIARQRLTRWWQPKECQVYLKQMECPPKP
jgi:WD40 repeat protein